MILGLLLGNTSLRYGILGDAGVLRSGRVEWERLEAAGGEIARWLEEHAVREAVAGSVRDDLLPRLGEVLPARLLPVTLVRRDFPLPIANRYERPEEAGTDRLLNAIAARERFPGRPSVVVDFGTAISMSAVSRDGAFLGGLIAAGGGALARSLLSTPRLPAEAPGRVPGFIQRNTAAALRAGLYWEVAGGARAMLEGIIGELEATGGAGPSPPPRVLATGGDAPLLAPAIPRIDEVIPDLTLEGLHHACRKGRSGGRG